MLAFAGALLLTPGFITDTIGFLCLTPPVRRAIAAKIIDSGMLMTMRSGSSTGFYYQSGGARYRKTDDSTIEGEFYQESEYISRENDEKN